MSAPKPDLGPSCSLRFGPHIYLIYGPRLSTYSGTRSDVNLSSAQQHRPFSRGSLLIHPNISPYIPVLRYRTGVMNISDCIRWKCRCEKGEKREPRRTLIRRTHTHRHAQTETDTLRENFVFHSARHVPSTSARRFSIIETSAQCPLLGVALLFFSYFFFFIFVRRPFPTTRQSNHHWVLANSRALIRAHVNSPKNPINLNQEPIA